MSEILISKLQLNETSLKLLSIILICISIYLDLLHECYF